MDTMKRIIDASARNNIQALSFTGGEPLLYRKQIIELLQYAQKAGIRYTRTGTNGFMFQQSDQSEWESQIRKFAEALSETGIYTFWISIDSAKPEVHEKMRGLPGVIKGIEKALPYFHENGLYPCANLGINRNTGGWWTDTMAQNIHSDENNYLYEFFMTSFARFYSFVIDLGFGTVNACYPMSIESSQNFNLEKVYGASSSDHIVNFTKDEKKAVYKALMDTIPSYRGKIRIFTPLCSLYEMIRYYGSGLTTGYSCRGGIDYFYIDAQTADTYPCGFRGNNNLGKFWEIDKKSFSTKTFCRQCEWECFRDPSNLLGPFLELRYNPVKLAGRFLRDKEFFRYWWHDIRYQKACDFFNARIAPNYTKMGKFETA